MKFPRILSTTSALALIASPALADVSAQQVWDDWQNVMGMYGIEVSTSGENVSGDTLAVSDVNAIMSFPEGTATIGLGTINFSEQGDGTVVVTMEDSLPMTMNVSGPDGESGTVSFTLNQPGGRQIASGDSSEIRYDLDYPALSMTDLKIEGDDIPEDLPVVFELAATGVTGFISMTTGELRRYVTESAMEAISVKMNFDEADAGKFDLNLAMTDLVSQASGTFAQINLEMTLAEQIAAGVRQTGTATYGPSTYEIAVDGPDGAFQMAASAQGGTLDATIDEGGIAYGGVTNGISVSGGGSAIPFPPMSFSMEKSEGRIAIPLVPGEEPQDFALVLSMMGLEVDQMLWSMFDPGEQLPRDPANVVIDLSGSATVMQDFLDPEYAENLSAPPGTLESVDINSIQLSLAGAELTGDGEFTFNNEMGIPLPSGVANVMLTGGNTLMDTLVGMGLLPEEQAMGARMMMGLFARPGDGPDTLVSTIEVNEDGSILANGQRIK